MHLSLDQDLTHDWRFRQVGQPDWHEASVPGCVHTDLRRNGLIPDPFYGRNERDLRWIETVDWEYALDFTPSEELLDCEFVDLVVDGLDTVATLELNGDELARTANMFVGWRFPIKGLLRGNSNRLVIRFRNPDAAIRDRDPNPQPIIADYLGGRTQLRKEQCSFGWDWGPRFATSGIWRPIRLEGWSKNRIAERRITQHHESGICQVQVETEATLPDVDDLTVRATLTHAGKPVAEHEGPVSERLDLAVQHPHLWWPNGLGDQPLYELTIEMLAGNEVIDRRQQRLGLCWIELDTGKDEWGRSFRFLVNGRPFFAKGANWIPAHAFANEGEALIPELLDSAVEVHMNMLRVWGGGIYEFDSFYEGCLERGILVWQDFMFSCALYPGDEDFLDLVRA
ncbi:MAG: hypothetical protein WA771_13675, partial [Chthoniobacterales bacterium]